MKYLTTKNKLPTAVLDWAINVTRNITFSHSGFLFTFNSTSDTRLKLTIYDMHPFKVLKVFSVPPLGRAHCLVFLGKTHYFHSAFLNQSVRKFNAGLTLPWTSIPPKGSRHTPSCFLQQEPRQAPAWLVACSYTDFTSQTFGGSYLSLPDYILNSCSASNVYLWQNLQQMCTEGSGVSLW